MHTSKHSKCSVLPSHALRQHKAFSVYVSEMIQMALSSVYVETFGTQKN